jgi:hypothetical protein
MQASTEESAFVPRLLGNASGTEIKEIARRQGTVADKPLQSQRAW